MLVQAMDRFKLLAWGLAAGAIAVAAVYTIRAPHSIWSRESELPNLKAAIRHEISGFQTVSWNEAVAAHDTFVPTGSGMPVVDRSETYTCEEPAQCLQVESPDHEFRIQPPAINKLADLHLPLCGTDGSRCIAPTCNVEEVCSVEKIETAEPMEVTNRRVTMRDAETNQTVATLTIAGMIESDKVPAEVLENAAEERKQNQRLRRSGLSNQRQNFVNAYRDTKTGKYRIEAQTTEISQLASEISEKFGLPIICHSSAIGTVSAQVSEVTPVRAVRRLVEPFGFAVVEHGENIVIGELDALERAAHQAARAREAEVLAEQEAARLEAEVRQAQNTAETQAAATKEMESQIDAAFAGQPQDAVSRASHQVPQLNLRAISSEELELAKKAKLMVADGQMAETIDMLLEGVSQFPDSPMLYRMLSEIYLYRNDVKAAECSCKRSLALDKSNPLTNEIYAEILGKMGQINRSQHYLRQARHLRGA